MVYMLENRTEQNKFKISEITSKDTND
jgi:hypothetical protein